VSRKNYIKNDFYALKKGITRREKLNAIKNYDMKAPRLLVQNCCRQKGQYL